jgi:hypothetical protein
MLKHILIPIEFDLFDQVVEILLHVEYQAEQNVTITALVKTQHFCISNRRTTAFSVSVGRLPKQLGNFQHISFLGTQNGKKFAARLKASPRHLSYRIY